MNVELVDDNYRQLQNQSQQTIAALSSLSQKLQNASRSGDQNAREWQLDLREIALQIQQEQNQVSLLLQSIHNFIASQAGQSGPPQAAYDPPQYPQQQQQYPQPQYQQPAQLQPQGGALHNFLGGNFGRAIVQGAGFGIGDDLINRLFR